LPRIKQHGSRFFWPVGFQPLQFNLEDAVIETRLDLVRIDPEGQLDGARERAVSALATLPVAVFRLPLALQSQYIVPQVEGYVIAGHTGSSAVTTTLLSPSQILIGGKSRDVAKPTPKTTGSFHSACAAAH